MSTETRYLTVPTVPPTWIPLGITEEDFRLMLESIELWKGRIVKPMPTAPIAPVRPLFEGEMEYPSKELYAGMPTTDPAIPN